MNPAIIIQARTGSSRLPSKMIKPFYGNQSILEILLSRLIQVKDSQYVSNIIVATTTNPLDNSIDAICKSKKIPCFRGDENDVLQRFIDTAEYYNAEKIIRICADNVFLDISSLMNLSMILNNSDHDYVSFKTLDGKPSILTHYGFFAEGVKLSTLKHVVKHTKESLFHEHVTNRIYTSPDIYDIKLYPMNDAIIGLEDHKKLRLTIDTLEDFEIQKKIYSDLIQRDRNLSPKTILDYLDNEHPEYYTIMEKIINANKK